MCLSKALGAPAGSVVVGTRDAIAKATRLRKALGGGMRQAGILAAAGIFALDERLPNLAADHANAQRYGYGTRPTLTPGHQCLLSLPLPTLPPPSPPPSLVQGLEALGFVVDPTETNLVYFKPPPDCPLDADTIVAAAEAVGVRFLCVGGGRMRMVTHHQVSTDGVERALRVIEEAVADPEATLREASGERAAAYAGGSK